MIKLNNNRSNPKSSKIVKRISIALMVLFLIMIFFGALNDELSMRDYGITCAKFIRTSRGKSGNYYEFQYSVGDSVIVSRRGGSKIQAIDQWSLYKMECVKIAYSKKELINFRILDKRVGDEWLWFLKDADK